MRFDELFHFSLLLSCELLISLGFLLTTTIENYQNNESRSFFLCSQIFELRLHFDEKLIVSSRLSNQQSNSLVMFFVSLKLKDLMVLIKTRQCESKQGTRFSRGVESPKRRTCFYGRLKQKEIVNDLYIFSPHSPHQKSYHPRSNLKFKNCFLSEIHIYLFGFSVSFTL